VCQPKSATSKGKMPFLPKDEVLWLVQPDSLELSKQLLSVLNSKSPRKQVATRLTGRLDDFSQCRSRRANLDSEALGIAGVGSPAREHFRNCFRYCRGF